MVEINTTALELRLPQDKLIRVKNMLINLNRRKTVKLHDLQSILWLLAFACSVVVPCRACLHRLYNLTCGIKYSRHHITLNKEARADLRAWQSFMIDFKGRRIFLKDVWFSSDQKRLFTDASSSCGFAAVFDCKWRVA